MYATSAAECQVSLITTMPLEARAAWAIKFSAFEVWQILALVDCNSDAAERSTDTSRLEIAYLWHTSRQIGS